MERYSPDDGKYPVSMFSYLLLYYRHISTFKKDKSILQTHELPLKILRFSSINNIKLVSQAKAFCFLNDLIFKAREIEMSDILQAFRVLSHLLQ